MFCRRPLVARSATSSVDGCGEAVEAAETTEAAKTQANVYEISESATAGKEESGK